MLSFKTPSANSFKQLPGPVFILVSAVGGVLLGITARLWMRWISTDPEFTWGGTLGIIFSFTIFCIAHSLLFVMQRRDKSKILIRIFRGIAIFFTLPLFAAAGAIMFPVVLLGSLAYWRKSWPKWLRIVLGILSAMWAARVAYMFIIKNFGWGFETIGQILVYLGIYILIIRITKGAVAFPRQPNYGTVNR